MRKSKYITILASVGFAMSAGAQTIETEVVIDREIVPVERAANRPTWVTPSIQSTRVEMKRLSLNEYVNAAEIKPTFTKLDPAQWADSVMRTPYRGYAAAGYFPVYNLGAAAGYRFVDNDKALAAAHISYEGATWNGEEGSEGRFSQHRFAIGADGEARFQPGVLTARFDYAYSGTGTARYPELYNRGSQGAHSVDLGFGWNHATTGAFSVNGALDFGFTGFANDKNEQLGPIPTLLAFDPAKDINLGLKASLAYALGSHNRVVLSIEGRLRHLNALKMLYPFAAIITGAPDGETVGYFAPESYGSSNFGIITFRPGYCFSSRNMSLRLGIRGDINAGGLDHETRIAPDIDFQWALNDKVAVFARATGAEIMNTNASLWQRNPWMTGVFGFERSHINADIEAGATFGSYRGFWGQLNVGWSSVADWLVPVVADGVNTWSSCKMKGFNYGLELGYSWRDMVTVVGHVKGAQHGSYYRWDDNAKWAFDIAAKGRPVAGLTVELGYEARVDRYGYMLEAVSTPALVPVAFLDYRTLGLGDTSNLYVGAAYDLTETTTVFLKAENILNHRWNLTPGILSRGVRGLLGLQLKF